MRTVDRELQGTLKRAARTFPSVVLTGPRRAGKTFLLRHTFPTASYHLFEDPEVVQRFRADPRGFLDGVTQPAIFDEIQNVPEVFEHVRARIDAAPRRTGRWLLTGSQESGLMQNVAESMAGRSAVLQLWPMSHHETDKVSLRHGGYPEVLARPRAAALWFASFVQTYLERDVRAMTAVQDLATFRRFLGLVASRHGQILNRTDLAAPLGVSVPTVSRWLGVLEATAQVLIVPPYFDNLGKRLVKSPKVYIADSGLACHLLGIDSDAQLRKSPFLGSLYEGFIAAEIVKRQVAAGKRREIYYFRDQQGLEVDFVVPARNGALHLVEVKATATPRPAMTAPMLKVAAAVQQSRTPRGKTMMTLVHLPTRTTPPSSAIAPQVTAVPWPEFVQGDFS